MKKAFVIVSMFIAFASNSQTFLLDFKDYDGKLVAAAIACHTGGDSITAKAVAEAARISLESKYDVAVEYAKLRPIDIICQYIGSIQYTYCLHHTPNDYFTCWSNYLGWLHVCKILIPVEPLLKKP